MADRVEAKIPFYPNPVSNHVLTSIQDRSREQCQFGATASSALLSIWCRSGSAVYLTILNCSEFNRSGSFVHGWLMAAGRLKVDRIKFVFKFRSLAKSTNFCRKWGAEFRLLILNVIEPFIQLQLDRSEFVDVVLVLLIGKLLYEWRSRSQASYGIIEVLLGLYLTHLAFHETGAFSNQFSNDFDIFHFTVQFTTYLAAIVATVRGFDNFEAGREILRKSFAKAFRR